MMTYEEIEKLVKLIEETKDEVTKTILRKLLSTEVELRGRITLPNNPPVWKAQNACAECGLKFEGTMGYVCTNPLCPTGLGPIMCGGS